MLYLGVLFLLTILLYFYLRNHLLKNIKIKENDLIKLKTEYDALVLENDARKEENAKLAKSAEEIIALYDITKDISVTLDEDKIFEIFKKRINNYFNISDCQFVKSSFDPSKFKDYAVLPLRIENKISGYLVVSGLNETDKERYHILAQQFLVGLKRAHLYKEVQELTITDSLTQIFSRRHFLERLEEEIRRSKKLKLNLSFLMIDIDRFKDFNDRYGHLVGDAILREIAKLIKETIRQIDFIGRFGGEELCITLAETDKEQARFAAERIREIIDLSRIKAYDEELKVTVSIGVSTFPIDAENWKILIENADKALYAAKQSGRNKVMIYSC